MGDEITLANITNSKDPSLAGWTQNMFLTACILSGCDYLPSLKKVTEWSYPQGMARIRHEKLHWLKNFLISIALIDEENISNNNQLNISSAPPPPPPGNN